MLGDLQELYNQFYRNWENYKNYLAENFLPQKIGLLRQQMIKQKQQYQLSMDEKRMLEQELDIAQNGFARYERMLNLGGISENSIRRRTLPVNSVRKGIYKLFVFIKIC
jgi:hypothetical protein